MLTLYHAPKSRSNSVVWLLEELGVPYQIRVVGDRFSAADIVVGGAIHYMTRFKGMNETPVLKAYTARLTARPAFKRAMEP